MARGDEDEEVDDKLLSYGSPRRSFSMNLSRANALESSTAAAAATERERDAVGSSGGDAQSLLEFYRQRCEQFHQERQTMLDHMARVEVSKEEFHRLKWELRTKNEEIGELEESLKKSNATLFQVKTEMIDLQAENKKLRIQEENDRQKIQHLLALTQPITEEVTFFRDCRPGTRASYPVTTTPTPQTYTYPSTMHISSEMGSQPRRRSQPMRSMPTSVPVRVSSSVAPNTNKVLRTVYMPHEHAAALTRTAESLQTQLVAHQQLSEERIQTLLDEFANEKAKLVQQKNQVEDKAQVFERQLEKSQRLLHQTTKDYLVLRHQSQEAERLAHEELFQMQEKCATLSTERKEVIQQAVAETQAMKRSVQEEGNVCAQEFRNQAQSRERDLHILKEQYAAVQEACTRRIQDLQARLTKLRSRYRSLDKRRAMEMEGFTRDITALKRHLQKLEVMHYGRRLTVQERQNVRLDEHYTLDSNELSEEVAALQHRVMELAAELADAMKTPSLLCVALIGGASALNAEEVAAANRDNDEPRLRLGPAAFSGRGCSAKDDSVSLSSDGSQLEVTFNSAFAAKGTTSLRHARTACNGAISLDVPKGYAVGITKDQLQGFVSIPDNEGSFAQVSSEYFFLSQRRGPKLKQRFETPGDAEFTLDAPAATIWSKCGIPTSLRVNTALIAHGEDATVGFGSASENAALRFSVEYKECSLDRED